MKRLIGLLIATTLEVGSGGAKPDWIDRTLATVDVTGTWTGSVGGASAGAGTLPDLLFEVVQQGSMVKGGFAAPGGWIFYNFSARLGPGPVAGTVTGDVFCFQQTSGNLSGEMKVSGDEMIG